MVQLASIGLKYGCVVAQVRELLSRMATSTSLMCALMAANSTVPGFRSNLSFVNQTSLESMF